MLKGVEIDIIDFYWHSFFKAYYLLNVLRIKKNFVEYVVLFSILLLYQITFNTVCSLNIHQRESTQQ